MAEQLGPATKDERRNYMVMRFSKLYRQAVVREIKVEHIRDSFSSANKSDKRFKTQNKKDTKKMESNGVVTVNQLIATIVVLVTILSSAYIYYVIEIQTINDFRYKVLNTGFQCAVEYRGYIKEVQRPVLNCSMCSSVNEVPIERNISAEDFRTKYAYTSLPVLVKGATHEWPAMNTFSFIFFKELYTNIKGALDYRKSQCLEFMPYSTKFDSLGDFFNMSDDRANFKDGEDPWYIGWSNCKKEVQTVLRQYYKRPYFLPTDAESSSVDWVFMGVPGPGVPLYLDHIIRPSWQAQITGAKTWTLVPVPECESVCKAMNVTVHKGDIIVVNTNHWYHTTWVEPGDISICIGSEYD